MKTLLLDLDGTMFRGNEPVEGAVSFINTLVQKRIPFCFLTNNARRTKNQNKEHMGKMGFQHIKEEHFYTSAMAAASYARNILQAQTAYIVGEDGLEEAVVEEGLKIVGENERADVVLVGLDLYADYPVYSRALHQLLSGAKLIGTNDDRRLSTGSGFDIGNGAIVRMLEFASDQKSPAIGKPHKIMLTAMLEKFHYDAKECIMVGDNLETDVAFGLNQGIDTIFITTGVHQREDRDRLHIHPSNIVDTFDEVLTYIENIK